MRPAASGSRVGPPGRGTDGEGAQGSPVESDAGVTHGENAPASSGAMKDEHLDPRPQPQLRESARAPGIETRGAEDHATAHRLTGQRRSILTHGETIPPGVRIETRGGSPMHVSWDLHEADDTPGLGTPNRSATKSGTTHPGPARRRANRSELGRRSGTHVWQGRFMGEDSAAAATHGSLWFDRIDAPVHAPLEGERTFDVAVVGAGITGLTTALLLTREGLSVCVLDQAEVASGTSGHTTAKVTSQHHLTYATLRTTHGRDGAAAYGAAMEAAKEQVSVLAEGIDCDLRRRPAHVYATQESEVASLERELQAAREAGLPAFLDESAPVPFRTYASLRFDDQIELHPRRYLLGLAERLVAEGGVIFEHTRALRVDESSDTCVVRTDHGRVTARDVVVATLLPFLDRGGFFARAHATRSYVVTARVRGDLPSAMLISAASPLRSIRAVPHGDEELLMIGGEGHRPGSSKADPARYDALAVFARQHWDVVEVTHRWSAQDYTSDDGVPYIGRLNLLSHRIRVATGFKKWGMTAGTLAGQLLCDDIVGRENPWAPFFSSTRVKPLAEAPRFVTENARVGYHFVADRVLDRGQRDIGDLAPGEGAIVSAAGHKVAGYRDDAGELHAVSATCTHLGCQVAWNAAERTWDCPCHASRFDPDGEVIEGPATRPLEPRPTGNG